ncbi:MAG: hypothetical protein HUJ73_01620 [Eubacterium sp.]|nr:hypothetical protein [Eubacterium sp.]
MVLTDPNSFSVYEPEKGMFAETAGVYEIQVAASSADVRLRETITISGETYDRDDRTRLPEYFGADLKDLSREVFSCLYEHPFSDFDESGPGNFTLCSSLEELSKASFIGNIMKNEALKEVRKRFNIKDEGDPTEVLYTSTVTDGPLDALVTGSGGTLPYHVAEAVVLSANGHKLKALKKLVFG